MRGGLALALEDPNSRMVRLGRDELSGMPHLSVDERLAKLEAVTLDDVQGIASELYTGQRMIGAVGPYDEGDLDRYLAV
jgi:predicted Zn-dependent peptidase